MAYTTWHCACGKLATHRHDGVSECEACYVKPRDAQAEALASIVAKHGTSRA